jgi:nucleotide-binding universal stress UspA family protein
MDRGRAISIVGRTAHEGLKLMNVLCVSDGSDDGYETVETLAGMLDRQHVGKVKVVIVTFPQHESPLWEKAYDLWLGADDLHRAMSIVAQKQLDRFNAVFEPHATSVESEIMAGEPVDEVLQSSKAFGADLILCGITGDERAHVVHRTAAEVVSKSPVPVVIAYGRAGAHDGRSLTNG